MSIIAIIGVIGLSVAVVLGLMRAREEQEALAAIVEQERKAQRSFNRRFSYEQEKLAKATAAAWERQRKEDARRDAQLAKHEEQIRKTQFQAEQAAADIEHLNGTLDELYAMLDYLKLEQSGTTPGGKEYVKYQSKIISLENRVHAAETRLAKARYTKSEAERKLA